MLLPAWVSIATVRAAASTHGFPFNSIADEECSLIAGQTLTILYHLAHRKINIRKETSASVGVFSIASFISMCSLLLQLHLTRDNDPEVPLFCMLQKLWFSMLGVAGGYVSRE